MKTLDSIILFGCGKSATEFYLKYKGMFSITYIISNNPKEKIFEPEDGVVYQVKRPRRKEGKESLIIICSNEFEDIAEQLILLGYIPFVDFIDYELAVTLLDERKIVLLYGFCHLRGIKDCLILSERFSIQYEAIFYPNYLSLNAYQQARLNYLIERCHMFIYGMAVTPMNNSKNLAILERLKPNVRKMCLQSVYFGGYFPQRKRVFNKMNRYSVKCDNYDYAPFFYEDSWLNECLDEGMDFEAILECLENAHIYDRDFILKNLEGEWKRLKFQENQSDFKIVDYIENDFRKKRLFRNEAHMENQVLYEYARQVLESLGCLDKIPLVEKPLLQCSQHIIYPEVSKILELKWDVCKEELDLYTYNGWKKMTLHDYVKTYIEVCGNIRSLKIKYFLP